MEAESEGKIYISPDLGVYQRWEVLEKCELVGKGPSFLRCMQEIILVACFMSMLGWPSTLHLPKLAKQIYNLQHQIAIIAL